MAETAPHLAVHVFPRAPVRQWVLSVPKRVRYFLQKDSAVEILARHIFLSAVEQGLRARSSAAGSISRIGAVAFIHRFGALLIAHVHFHCVVIEGVFEAEAIGGVRFHKAQGVGAETVAEVQAKLSRRVLRALARRGLLEREERRPWAPGITPGPAALATAAVALGGSAC